VIAIVAWMLAGSVVLVPISIALGMGAPELGESGADLVAMLSFLLVGPLYAITGALIVSRQGRNSVGWLLMAVAVGLSLGILSDVLVPAEAPVATSPLVILLLGLSSVSWVFFMFPIFHLLLVFPTGRVLSPRWRPLVALEGVMVGWMLFSAIFAERITAIDERWSVQNPIGFIPDAAFGPVFGVLWSAGLLALTLGGLLSIVLRFGRSRGVERLQLKWFLYAVSLFAIGYGGAAVWPGAQDSAAFGMLVPVAMMGLGLAIAVALLRYRLFEIDRIVSRTVSYAVIVGLLAGGVALVATVVGTRFDQPVVVAATTLCVAAAFNPLRRRVQVVVDRRFNRSRYDAENLMSEFVESLRGRVDPVEVVDGWLGVVSTTMQPVSLSVWLRSG
jgi:hypothetical protein